MNTGSFLVTNGCFVREAEMNGFRRCCMSCLSNLQGELDVLSIAHDGSSCMMYVMGTCALCGADSVAVMFRIARDEEMEVTE